MIIRALFFIGILFLTTGAPLVLLIIVFSIYALRYTAYELLAVAVCIDSLYSATVSVITIPYYTIGTIVGLVIIEWIKPRLSVYNQ